MSDAKRVVIAGGGLAGLTCAKYLVDAGHGVAVYEGLPYLGGRASTYRDADGEWVEQGLHLFFGVYSEFLTLLREVGVDPDSILCWMSEIRVQDAETGDGAMYGINPFRAPLETVRRALGQNHFLGVRAKLAVARMALPALLGFEHLRRRFDGRTVTEWWAEAGGGHPDVMERFVRPFCRGIQFSEPEQFSAFDFLGWIHHIARALPRSLAGGYRGARDETIFQPLGRYLTERGATIRTGAKLRAIEYAAGSGGARSGRVTGFLLEDGTRAEGDAYVAAVPVWALAPLVPAGLRDEPFFARLADLPVAPAISVQLWFDRRVVDTPDFTLVGKTRAAVYQDQSTNAYPYPRGSRLSVIVAPADDLLGESDAALVETVLVALRRVAPAVAEAAVVKSVVLKHEKHLVRPAPGAMSARPTQATPVPNFFLAGDWTQQAFFGSQEGAVRGGKACAAAVRAALEPARGAR